MLYCVHSCALISLRILTLTAVLTVFTVVSRVSPGVRTQIYSVFTVVSLVSPGVRTLTDVLTVFTVVSLVSPGVLTLAGVLPPVFLTCPSMLTRVGPA